MKRGRWLGKGVGAWRGIWRSWGPRAAFGGSESALARAVGGDGTGPAGWQTRPLGDCAVRARPAWPQVPLDEAALRARTGEWPAPGPAVARSPAPAPPLAAASLVPRARSRRSPPPAGASIPGRRQHRPSGWEEDGGRWTASPVQTAPRVVVLELTVGACA